MKLDKMLGHMSYAVAAIQGARDAAAARSAKLPEKDPLRGRLRQLSTDLDGLRSRIVATKEGGAITGEERIREHLGDRALARNVLTVRISLSSRGRA